MPCNVCASAWAPSTTNSSSTEMDTQDDKSTFPGPEPGQGYDHWHMKRHKFRFLIPVFVLAAIAALGTVVMLLWNHIVPGLTGWQQLTWWKAVGLLVLCR